MLSSNEIKKFRQTIYTYYRKHGRHHLLWRHTTDPYKILVSEIMLQQTQVDRVLPKYKEFIKAFSNFKALAKAPLSKVLKAWNGLGYNRRAVYLKRIAEHVVTANTGAYIPAPPEYQIDGVPPRRDNTPLPDDPNELRKFPGLGPTCAASVVVFAFNKPLVFLETNIRTVFIHCFFTKRIRREGVYPRTFPISNRRDPAAAGQYAPTHAKLITDDVLLPLVEATLDRENPREWYYALMDYGVYLKKQFKNPTRRSAHYTKQSAFEGSNRQARGQIIKLVVEKQKTTLKQLSRLTKTSQATLNKNLRALTREGFLVVTSRGIITLRR